MTLGAQDLSLDRGGKRVLCDVSVRLNPGTITAIVGPNGAGKSSLLLALAGLLEPATGRVNLDGRGLQDSPARKKARALGYLPQSAEIAWDVAVETLIALGRLPHRDRGTAAIERAIAALELQEFRKRPASRLSGGERARVLLARVLAGEPQWILADEPLAALDLAHQLNLITHLKACAAQGQGVVIVLHDLALAMNHADRVVVLSKGGLIADGPPADALSESVIKQAWGVNGSWIGEQGARALVI
ncbi:ATP-binding cassette domain-containing protein [Erythrobacter insulae]|uniref:ATP-binding cassette domain-containing protein n=1 Tax=Erythrobacter insulae TaxID=2584124 RepID=A0A547PFF9_9SPHN|nr:ATP-binding cassette domain-containing protein [Erythrobacter insulae]TRD12841.1 ATP-binding cassette domain-containing protein [Erythrobacter insulae]